MNWLGFALVAFLAIGWLITSLLLAFTRGELVVEEEQVARFARENGILRDRLGIDWRGEIEP